MNHLKEKDKRQQKHGRIKVKTTAEQQEAKRKEREKKLKIYNAGTAASFKKKGEKEYDEEGLKISGEILSVNPDFYTLWNYRKEAYLHLKDNRSPEELQSLMANELYFLENCLKVNPKSYGTWHHRCFIMENMPEPDWGRELQLCNTFLEMDERNFHCWDYRRYVVLMSEVDLEEELDYTTQKIQSNFSNYSSWHYRSKLLPMIHPDHTNPTRVQEDILLQEHETVQNAVFTDPDDQSAWFYHRWLLGRGRKKLQISCVHINRNHKRIIVLLTNPIRVPYGHSLQLHINGTSVDVTWKNVLGDPYHNSIWMCHFEKDIPSDVEVSIAVTLETHSDATQFSQGLHLPANQNEAWVMAEYKVGSRFSAELSAAATSTLEKELEAIKELHSVEPENKWVLLTLLFLMKAMDPRHDNCSAEITDCFFKLVHVDEKRKYYYRDLKSKFVMESVLDSQEVDCRQMNLSNRSLTSLFHTEWMVLVNDLDLSQNSLTSVKPLHNLQCLQCLCLDNNLIQNLEGIQHCQLLEELSLKKNSLRVVAALDPLKHCSALLKLNVAGNPLCLMEDYISKISALLPSLNVLNDQKLQQ